MGRLEGKVALVTGASSGIGAAIARLLATEGAAVAVAARRQDRLSTLVTQIEASAGRALSLPGDIADQVTARRFVAETIGQLGRLDILVNSAGAIESGGVAEADTAAWRRLMDVNYFGSLYTCSAAVEHMRAQRAGDIINISSTAARRATSIFNAYSSSKHALNAMTEGMRQELGGLGIRVCVIEPGATTTDIVAGISHPKIRDKMRERLSKEGAMAPEDIAAAVLFVVTLPSRVNVSELLIRPTIDTDPL